MLRPSLAAIPARPLARLPALGRVDPVVVRRATIIIVPLVAYLVLGLVFSLGAGIITGDAWSRVGNAYYVLFSRDPHLAAIGFVWNPLPSVVDGLLLPLALLWRPIVDHGVAGNLMSAAFMALAVRELWLWLRELGTPKPARIGLTVAFALHPMIVLYGSNGMSEAPFLFFLLVSGRAVSAWTRTSSVSRLAIGGFGLALAYLTRYEAVAPIAALVLVTAGIAYWRASGTRAERAMTGLADALIVGTPAVGAFVLWAFASWIIVGSPFDTFTSVYGNSSQVGLSLDAIRASTGNTLGGAFAYFVSQLLSLEPYLPIVVLLAAAVAAVRRDVRVLVPLATFGSVLLLSAILFLAGGSFGWLRFSIGAVPLAVVCLGLALARDPATARSASTLDQGRQGWPRVLVARLTGPIVAVVTTITVALALVAVPAAVNSVFDSRLAREEAPKLAGLIAGDRLMPGERRQFLVAGELARDLDARNLPHGSVVVDVALGFWIVLQSDRPEQFVITPDRDFERIVADPAAFDAQYLLVSPPTGLGGLGALERAHPGLYETGAGIATLIGTYGDAKTTGVAWRLYRVDQDHG